MTTVQVAIFRVARAENYWRVTASVMSFPLTSPGAGATVSVGKLFPATLTVSTGFLKGSLNLIRRELVVVCHELSSPSHQKAIIGLSGMN